MKKFLALFIFATMIFTGCGSNTAEDAKTTATEKVDEAKDAATAKVEEVKQNAEAKVDEVKNDAAAKVEETAAGIADGIRAGKKAPKVEVALGGVIPGITRDELLDVLGNPVDNDGDKLIFANGLRVELDDGKVDEITSRSPEIFTPTGLAVGASEYSLNDFYGPADDVDIEIGETEYKYIGDDRRSELKIKARGGVIVEIQANARD